MIGDFHFLRPEMLWGLIPVALVVFLASRRRGNVARWRSVIAPHLLEHLIVRPTTRLTVRPELLLGVVLGVALLAGAGPTYRREPPPFTQDTAPLVIALDLSRSMLVSDIQPSRLERAQQKVRELLDSRAGARTALLVYAGSAHMVLPLTDDPSVLEAYVTSLDPSVMPVEGKRPAAALSLAETMLEDDPTPGTILFLTDGIDVDSVPAFSEHARSQRDQVLVLAVGTEAGGPVPLQDGKVGPVSRLDRAGLEELDRQDGAWVTTVTIDDTDVRRLDRRIASHLTAVQQENAEGRWRDDGWWLVLPLVLMVSLWGRRGWTVQWDA